MSSSPPPITPEDEPIHLTIESPPDCLIPSSKKKRRTPFGVKSTISRITSKYRQKIRKMKRRSIKKTLFPTCGEERKYEEELKELLPNLLESLAESNKQHDFMSLVRLIAQKKFPMDNIAFSLLLDVARFYSLPTTRHMTYPDCTKQFWRVGYKLFHGSFLRFMSGGKSEGQLIDSGESGRDDNKNLSPMDANVNFAVPDIKSIREYKGCDSLRDLPRELPPGVIEESIDMKANINKNVSYVLCVDGKKIAPGLNETSGDENLFGHERPKLKERLEALQSDLAAIEVLLHEDEISIQTIFRCARRLSLRVKDLRELKVKQSFALERFMKWAGEDWRNGKYAHAISSTQARLYQVRRFICHLNIYHLSWPPSRY